MTTKQAANVIFAETMGRIARKNGGAVRAPAQDKNIMALIAKDDALALPLLKAWNRGFLSA